MRKRTLITTFVAASCLLLANTAGADSRQERPGPQAIEIGLTGIGPGAGAVGEVLVFARDRRPDTFLLRVSHLPPRTRISVFLTEDPEPGRLPAQFMGEFRTDRHGRGRLRLVTEIVDAFASANQILEDESGVADEVAGLLVDAGGTANTIALNSIRGYFVPEDGGGNVFGTSEDLPGGPIAFISEDELP